MPFDLTTWKTTVRKRLTNWKPRIKEFGVDSVYASLCAMTLWPVAEAAKGGEWAALAELGKVLASLGSNLVASRVDKWKNEADAARQLAVDTKKEPALRDELDKVLQTLETVALAQNGSSEEDRQWLVATLREELERYGTSAPTILTLTGPGAIATTGGVAAGAGGVAVGGDLKGSAFINSPVEHVTNVSST